MGNVGAGEILIVLIIALIVLGPQRLPEVARTVGRGIREFREAIATGGDDDYDDRRGDDDEEPHADDLDDRAPPAYEDDDAERGLPERR